MFIGIGLFNGSLSTNTGLFDGQVVRESGRLYGGPDAHIPVPQDIGVSRATTPDKIPDTGLLYKKRRVIKKSHYTKS